MSELARTSLGTLLDELAAPTPAPGGGSSAALAAALGSALVEMAAGIEEAREGAGSLSPLPREQLRELRAHALELAERELGSYAPVLEVLRLPPDDPARGPRLAAALEEASHAPVAIAEIAAEAAARGAATAATSQASVRGDAQAGVILCEAAAAAAAALVEINLAGAPDSALLARARAAREAARAAREGLAERPPPR